MALLKFKRSAVAGKVPTLSDLPLGELAINTFDGKIYIRKDNGTASVVEIGAGAGTGVLSFNTRTGAVTLTSSDVTSALGYTPYNATNPAGYITSSGSITGNAGNVTGVVAVLNGGTGVTTSTGTGSVVLSNSPTFVTPALGAATATSVSLTKLALTNDSPFYTGGNISSGANNLGIGTTGANVFGVFTNNLERLRVNSSGNVGIGITAPAARVHILNSSIAEQFRLQDVLTDATTKYGVIGAAHYTNAQAAVSVAMSTSTATSNAIVVGGGVTTMNAATLIQFFTAANATTLIGTERVRITAAGNMGIGTPSPTGKLTVSDAGAAGYEINPTGGVGGGATIVTYNRSTLAYTTLTTYSSAMTWFTGAAGSTRAMDIDGNGNVGIATSSPTAKLTVNGTAKVGEGVATNTSKLMVNTVSGTAAGIQLFQDNNESWIIQNPATSTALTFSNSGTERMRLASDGTLSVGGAFAENSTGVYALSTGELRVKDGTEDGTSQISIYNTNTTNDSEQFYVAMNLADIEMGNRRGGYLALRTSNAERMRISSAGNVGIGNTAPATPLDVTGTTRSGNFRVNSGGTVTGSGIWGTDTVLAFNTNSNERMRIDTSGNVGVGTTAPNAQLHVSFSPIASIPALGSGVGALALGPAANYGMLLGTISNGKGFIQQQRFDTTTTVYDLLLQPNGGNVGIGTTAAVYKLDVSGGDIRLATNATYIRSVTSGGTNVRMLGINATNVAYVGPIDTGPTSTIFNASSSSTSASFYTSGTERMLINTDGNVGIGTASPTVKLHLFDTLAPQVRLQIGTTTSQGAYTFYSSTINEAGIGFTPNTANMNIYAGRSAAWGGHITLTTDLTERMRITQSGTVGIGTSVPRGTLSLGTSLATATTQTIHMGYTAADFYGWRFNSTNTPSATSAGNLTIQRGTTTAWADDLTITNTGDVGIGVTAPAAKLHISGSQRITHAGDRVIDFVRTSANSFSIEHDTSRMYFYNITTATSVLAFDNASNVGIGTASPSAKLHLSGGNFYIANSGTYAEPAIIAGVIAFDSTNGDLNISARSNGGNTFTRFFTSSAGTGAERMRITSAGDVGIGTTAPSNKLSVAGGQVNTVADGAYAIALNAATGNVRILPYNATYSGSALIAYNAGYTGNGPLAIDTSLTSFWTNGTERMRLLSSGNLLLGRTTAYTQAYRLVVNGNSETIAIPMAINDDRAGTADSRILAFLRAGTETGYITSSNTVLSVAGNTTLAFQTASTEKMRITNTGDVGIGTAAPSGKLEVYQTAVSPTIRMFTNFVGGNAVDLNPYIGGVSNGGYSVSIGGTIRQVIDASGNMGIGTTTPASNLNISTTSGAAPVNTTSTNALRLTSTTTAAVGVGPSILFEGQTGNTTANYGFAAIQGFKSSATAGDYSGSLGFFTQASGGASALTEQMRITSAGNVGIGTASPSHRLHVNGNVYVPIANSYYCYTADYGMGTPASSGLQIFTGASDTIRFGHMASGTFTERMRMTAAGSLGIGTQTPAGSLHVSGTTGFTWSGGSTSSGLVTIGTQGATGGSLFINTNSLNTSFASGLAIDGTYTSPLSTVNIKAVGVNSGGGYGAILAFHTSDESALFERMRINQVGNVGIATTSPQARLQVGGSTSPSQLRIYGGLAGTSSPQLMLYAASSDHNWTLVGNHNAALTFNKGTFGAVGGELMRLDIDGRLLIGTTAADQLLTIAGNIATTNGADRYIKLSSSSNYNYTLSAVGDDFRILENGTTARLAIKYPNGNVGIGTTDPTQKLHVVGQILASDNITAYSDKRLKDNIVTVSDALALVSKMRGVTYTRKDTGQAGVGVVAQEMKEVLPQVVQEGEYMSVAYGNVVGVLIEAIKELTARVAQLEGK
jgi:hypothetical protein